VLRWTFQTCVQIDLRKHYFQTLTMMQNQGWFAPEKGIECLHIEFTLAEEVFESRTTQNKERMLNYMFESRTTQMQERENDEDITNMDTPTVVAYDSNVKLFFSIIIFNTCDEWMLHHDMCSMSFIEVLTWIKEDVDHAWKGRIMKHLD
jgi:hypothetical protein